MDRTQKKQFVDDLEGKLQKSEIVVLLNFSGLTVSEMNSLRRKLDGEEVELQVSKNTLVELAAQRAGLEELKPFLNGPTSLLMAYDDPIAPMKALADYLKSNKKLEVKAAYFGGKIIDLEGVKQLASMPSREQLFGQLLGTLQAPMSQLVGVLSALPRDVVTVLNAYKDKLGQDVQS